MEKNLPPADVTASEPASPLAQVRDLIDEVRGLAEAEVAYAKARISYSGGILRKAGLFALLAFLCFSAAIVALVLGLLLIAASFWGPLVATLIIVSLLVVATVGSALYARKTARKLKFEEGDSNG